MAKKPSRTNLKLQDIPPSSVRRIFSFINILLNRHRLSVDYFKKQITSFNPIEQYFICDYCKRYFSNKSSGIYLYKWLEEQFQLYEDNGESEAYEELDNLINCNQERLLIILPFIEKSAEKRAIDLQRFNVPYIKYLDFYNDNPLECRIPLLYNKTEFKEMFFNIWLELYNEDQVEEIYLNTFQFTFDHFPQEILFVEIDRKMLVYSQMAYTIEKYKSHVNRQTEKKAIEYNQQLEKLSGLRKDFTASHNYESVIRLSFAKMMYNTFPDVRDSYSNKLIKDPNYSLDLYFENIIKNFSKRK